MPKLDFTDVFQSLLPDGSAWDPSDALHVYGTYTGTGIDFVGDRITASDNLTALNFHAGDTLTIVGTVFNDGDYTVAQDYDPAQPTWLYIEGTFTIPETVFPGICSFTCTTYGGFFKLLLTACGLNHETMWTFLSTLAYLRDPQNTPILSDLEREYGLKLNTALTEQERRDRLDAIVYAPAGTGSPSYLEEQLHAGGFVDCFVYSNSKSNDPGAFYGGPGGEIIVNGDPYDRTIAEARSDPNLWPFVFFIGGTAYYDTSGRIVHIAPAPVSDALKPAFQEIVLKCKPVHSWAIAIINDYQFFTFSTDDTAQTDADKGFLSEDELSGGYWFEGDEDSYYGWIYALVDDDTWYDIIDDDTSDLVVEG